MHPKVYSVEVFGRQGWRSHRTPLGSSWRDALWVGLVVEALWKTGSLAR
jgi:hypothetical protein